MSEQKMFVFKAHCLLMADDIDDAIRVIGEHFQEKVDHAHGDETRLKGVIDIYPDPDYAALS